VNKDFEKGNLILGVKEKNIDNLANINNVQIKENDHVKTNESNGNINKKSMDSQDSSSAPLNMQIPKKIISFKNFEDANFH
jgi:hypothetical protein